MRTSPLWPAALPASALLLAGVRWLLQGDASLYTSFEQTFYVPDPDLGWRAADSGAIWLGADVLGILAAATSGIAGAGLAIRWRERRAGSAMRWARRALIAAGAATLAVPLAAFLSGSGPAGAQTSVPTGIVKAPESGVEGVISGAPAGTYVIVEHRATNLVASLKAGGDSLEARWETTVRGQWRGDPADLRQPMTAKISAEAEAIDTGIKMRDGHARGYLETEAHPRIGFALRSLEAARPEGDGIAFSARGEVELMGLNHPVDIAGTLRPVSDEARARLELPEGDVLIATAEFELDTETTALAEKDLFDEPNLSIRASLVLAHEVPDSAQPK